MRVEGRVLVGGELTGPAVTQLASLGGHSNTQFYIPIGRFPTAIDLARMTLGKHSRTMDRKVYMKRSVRSVLNASCPRSVNTRDSPVTLPLN